MSPADVRPVIERSPVLSVQSLGSDQLGVVHGDGYELHS